MFSLSRTVKLQSLSVWNLYSQSLICLFKACHGGIRVCCSVDEVISGSENKLQVLRLNPEARKLSECGFTAPCYPGLFHSCGHKLKLNCTVIYIRIVVLF